MRKILACLASICLITGCSNQSLPTDLSPQQSEPIPPSASCADTDLSSQQSEPIPSASDSETELNPDDFLPSTEIGAIEIGHDDELFDELFNLAEKMISEYQNGTIKSNERFPPLPDDYLFPPNWSGEDITILYSKVMGDYTITLPSVDGKWDMILVANNFVYVSAESVTGGELHVADVYFHLKHCK